MRKEKDKIALFKLLDSRGEVGFHIMYICIKRDRENPLGHDSARKELEKRGKSSRVYVQPVQILS